MSPPNVQLPGPRLILDYALAAQERAEESRDSHWKDSTIPDQFFRKRAAEFSASEQHGNDKNATNRPGMSYFSPQPRSLPSLILPEPEGGHGRRSSSELSTATSSSFTSTTRTARSPRRADDNPMDLDPPLAPP